MTAKLLCPKVGFPKYAMIRFMASISTWISNKVTIPNIRLNIGGI